MGGGIRKVQARAGQIKEVTKEEAQVLFQERAIPQDKVDGYEERVSALENEIAFLIAAISKNLISSDDYRLITFDNKILKAL